MTFLGMHEFLHLPAINCFNYNLSAVTLCHQQIDPNIQQTKWRKPLKSNEGLFLNPGPMNQQRWLLYLKRTDN